MREKKKYIYIKKKKNWAINLTHLLLSFPTAPLGREDEKKKKKMKEKGCGKWRRCIGKQWEKKKKRNIYIYIYIYELWREKKRRTIERKREDEVVLFKPLWGYLVHSTQIMILWFESKINGYH